MKIARFGAIGAEKPGLVDANGTIRDASAHISDITPETIASGEAGSLASIDPTTLPEAPSGTRIGSPIARTGHFIAIGLNYEDHAIESNLPIPDEPVVFSKAPSCLVGPNDDVVVPKGSTKLDWEVELAFVISKEASYVSKEDALNHVFAYTICNDVSERAFQIEGTGQWIKGKSAPTFGPTGPFLATPDEIGAPGDLDMFLDVNGERMQSGNTKTMIFDVATIISYLSEKMILLPGDLITTGTPPGVGMGKNPPRYLNAGDVMTVGIQGLGEQTQNVKPLG
ncbi:MAG: fumarylacetoacetate hydrolase family protein [Pseudomonadota bacterium]